MKSEEYSITELVEHCRQWTLGDKFRFVMTKDQNGDSVLPPAPAERWETVEEWEDRTGKVYPDDGPVWVSLFNVGWDSSKQNEECYGYCDPFICVYSKAKAHKYRYINDMYIPRIGHGKPPTNGKGEEG